MRALVAGLAAAGLLLVCIVTGTVFDVLAGQPPASLAAANAGALVRVGDGTTSSYTVAPGDLLTVPIEVVDAVNLGSATVLLSFDPAVVRAVGCVGPRSAQFDGGYCNADYDVGVAKFYVIALDGADGTHRLYDITFEAVGGAPGTDRTDLSLTIEQFADPLGNPLGADTAGGQIEITGEPAPVDAVVRVGDAAQSDFSLVPGESVDVPITLSITGTRDLGAATMLLRYDPQVVRPTWCDHPASIQGYCNPNFDPADGLVKFNLLSSAGLTGTVHAYDVRFEVVSGVPAGAVSSLVLIVEHFADPQGSPMTWAVVNGSITVAAGPSNSARVLVGAPSATGTYTVSHGMTTTVSVWVTDVVDLGAATLSLGYDPAVVRPLGCAVRDDLAPEIDGGACTLNGNRVRANLISSAGLDGDARLYDVDFTPALGAPVGATSLLTPTVENFADTAAMPIPSRAYTGSIQVEAGGPGQPVALVRVGDDTNGGAFELPQDGGVVVPIRVEATAGLGATTLLLNYDPAVVRPVTCTAGDDVFDGGFCNPSAGDGVVRMNVVSTSGFTGDATLFEVAFQPADEVDVGAQTNLALAVTNFDSPAGEPLLYHTAGGTIEISPPVGPPDVTLHAGAGSYRVEVGERITIPVSATINTVTRTLGAATLVLSYDPGALQPTTCRLNDDGAPNGFDGGGCNTAYAVGQIKFNAVSVAGVADDTVITEVQFEVIGQGGTDVQLSLGVEHLADPAADPLTHEIETSSIEIPPLDGNGDGIPDSQQTNVTSLRNVGDGSYMTLVSDEGTTLADAQTIDNPSPDDMPYGLELSTDVVTFKVQGVESGTAATVTLLLPAGTAAGTYYKYGPTPDDPTSHWYEFLFACPEPCRRDGTTGAEIQDNTVILHFVDGERGDADLTANGEIVDPGVPVVCHVSLAATFVSAEPSGSVDLTAQVSNQGSIDVPAGLPVAFYLGDPASSGTLLGAAQTTQALDLGSFEDVTISWADDVPGDHAISIVANDGNPLNLCSTPPPVQQTVSILDVPLVEGWNLMSTYVNPFNPSCDVVERSIHGQYVVIQGFDGGAQSYYPHLPAALNTLKEMDAWHGYWIKTVGSDGPNSFGTLSVNSEQTEVNSPRKTQDGSTVATLRVVGEKLAEDTPMNLEAGWNLVSYLPRRPLSVTDALQSIDGLYTAVLGYDDRGALSYYADLDPTFNTLKDMEPLYGYWIKMSQAGTLQYPVTSDVLSLSKGNQLTVNSEQSWVNSDDRPLDTDHWSLFTAHSTTWVNFYGSVALPVGTAVLAVDPDGVVCGVAVVHTEGQYGLLACYGDDPDTPADEGAQAGDVIRLVADGQTLGTGVWTAHGGRQQVPRGPASAWQVWLPLLRVSGSPGQRQP